MILEDVKGNKLQIKFSGEYIEDLLIQYLFQLPFSISFSTAETEELKTNPRYLMARIPNAFYAP